MTTVPAAEQKTKSASAASAEADRRRRRRAKISAQVHVRAENETGGFEEVCPSIDVSRDGLLFTASHAGYWKGQKLKVMFPYSTAATAINTEQVADIVRVNELAGGKFAVAVHFQAALGSGASETKAAAYVTGRAGSTATPNATDQKLAVPRPVVLAVEPDERTAEIMRNMLQHDGYTVLIVPTAREALDVLRTTVPAVFIAEVEADDMSGHDLCLIIKRNERLQRVPVILLTRAAKTADYSASHQLGAVVCMAKPFQPERLQHVIHLLAPPAQAGKSAYTTRGPSIAVERTLL